MRPLLSIAVMAIALAAVGCSGLATRDGGPRDRAKADGVTIDARKVDGSKAVIGSQEEVKIIVTNSKTKQSWEFSAKEYKLFIDGWRNWRTVTGVEPEVSEFAEDKKSYFITFNYYRKSDDGRTKTSVLAGRIVIDKDKFDPSNSCKMAKGLNIGLGAYGIVITVAFFLLIFL